MPTQKEDDHLVPAEEKALDPEEALEEALEETFPASDPIAPMRPGEA